MSLHANHQPPPGPSNYAQGPSITLRSGTGMQYVREHRYGETRINITLTRDQEFQLVDAYVLINDPVLLVMNEKGLMFECEWQYVQRPPY